jgi:hypothetical protein
MSEVYRITTYIRKVLPCYTHINNGLMKEV